MFVSLLMSYPLHFYPRPPRGGRRGQFPYGVRALDFYPRPPRGGRPSLCGEWASLCGISIHVLREEDDLRLPLILVL